MLLLHPPVCGFSREIPPQDLIKYLHVFLILLCISKWVLHQPCSVTPFSSVESMLGDKSSCVHKEAEDDSQRLSDIMKLFRCYRPAYRTASSYQASGHDGHADVWHTPFGSIRRTSDPFIHSLLEADVWFVVRELCLMSHLKDSIWQWICVNVLFSCIISHVEKKNTSVFLFSLIFYNWSITHFIQKSFELVCKCWFFRTQNTFTTP